MKSIYRAPRGLARKNWHGVPELAAALSEKTDRPITIWAIYSVLKGRSKSARAVKLIRKAEKKLGVKVLEDKNAAAPARGTMEVSQDRYDALNRLLKQCGPPAATALGALSCAALNRKTEPSNELMQLVVELADAEGFPAALAWIKQWEEER